MNKIDLHGLYCYTRQVALSLDRREHNKDENLKIYFDDRLCPHLVLKFYKENNITDDNLPTCLSLLEEFNDYLVKLYDDSEKLMILRVNLSKLCDNFSKDISVKSRKELDKVEHYNQSDYVETLPINLINEDWYNKIKSF